MDYAVSVVPGWYSGSPPFFGTVRLLLFAIFALPMLVALTRAAMNEGDSVERPNRVRQWYGYLVCLIAVVTGLITVAGVLDNAFDLSNPLAAEGPYGESLMSFDAYMATRSPRFIPPDRQAAPDTASQATLRARYEALRAERIAQRRFTAEKGLVTDLILLAIAIGLFFTHWRWLRRLPDQEGSGRAA